MGMTIDWKIRGLLWEYNLAEMAEEMVNYDKQNRYSLYSFQWYHPLLYFYQLPVYKCLEYILDVYAVQAMH